MMAPTAKSRLHRQTCRTFLTEDALAVVNRTPAL